MAAEFAIAFELIFREELVGSGFVGEGRMGGAVLGNADVFVAGDGGLEIDEVAGTAIAVLDAADGAVGEAVLIALLLDGLNVELDNGSEVSGTDTDEIAEAAEFEVFVAFGIAGDDDFAAAADEFVDAEIFEVAAVGDVEEEAGFVGESEEFAGQVVEAEAESAFGPCISAGIGEPPAEAHIEHGEQESDEGRGVVAHVGAGGGSGDGDGLTNFDAVGKAGAVGCIGTGEGGGIADSGAVRAAAQGGEGERGAVSAVDGEV